MTTECPRHSLEPRRMTPKCSRHLGESGRMNTANTGIRHSSFTSALTLVIRECKPLIKIRFQSAYGFSA